MISRGLSSMKFAVLGYVPSSISHRRVRAVNHAGKLEKNGRAGAPFLFRFGNLLAAP